MEPTKDDYELTIEKFEEEIKKAKSQILQGKITLEIAEAAITRFKLKIKQMKY